MTRVEFEDRSVWERIRAAEETHEREDLREDSWIEGENGEAYFDNRVLQAAKGRRVIDIGCGRGEFTLAVASVARKIVGVDFSKRAIDKAVQSAPRRASAKVEFKLGDARKLPYPAESFDLAYSRRGPATDSLRTIRETYRVLRKDGLLIQQEIGERDKLNWKRVFGRGQNYPFKETIHDEKSRLLAEAGFRRIRIREFESKEYFKSMTDAVMRLETTPIIPAFNKAKDRRYLQKLEETFTTRKGIGTNLHRVIITATK